MGRPQHQPDPVLRRQVEAMAAYGVPETEIGRTIGVDAKTLRRHYRDELDLGHVKANTKVAEALYRKATTDGPQSVTAAIFWLKARAGWKEASSMEVSGAGGGPIEVAAVPDFSGLSREERGLLRQMLVRRIAAVPSPGGVPGGE